MAQPLTIHSRVKKRLLDLAIRDAFPQGSLNEHRCGVMILHPDCEAKGLARLACPTSDSSTIDNFEIDESRVAYFRGKVSHSVAELCDSFNKHRGLAVQLRLFDDPERDLDPGLTTIRQLLDPDGVIIFQAEQEMRAVYVPTPMLVESTTATAARDATRKADASHSPSQLSSERQVDTAMSPQHVISPDMVCESPGPSQITSTPATSVSASQPTATSVPDTQPSEDMAIDTKQCNASYARPNIPATELHEDTKILRSKVFLCKLRQHFDADSMADEDAGHWSSRIEKLQHHRVNVPAIIGVVGGTGAGKSSVINAVLDEERLIPTNCMRACTAVVTEISWNESTLPDERYRADIEFVTAADWAEDLRLCYADMLDGRGNLSKDVQQSDSDAAIAWAKLRAVYFHKTRAELGEASPELLMQDPEVQQLLGTTRSICAAASDVFVHKLQKYLDSRESSRATDEAAERTPAKSKQQGKSSMGFWPLIKVVRIYTRAEALSTGAVIVDLPGVHDSNAARSAVASGYMKSCTRLWVVAPITRAVDDQSAKRLLGNAFKQQLRYDGNLNHVTFICSKTDDISLTEASLNLECTDDVDQLIAENALYAEQEKLIRFKRAQAVNDREHHMNIVDQADEDTVLWETLESDVKANREVYAPETVVSPLKRKATPEMPTPSKRRRAGHAIIPDYDDDDDDEEDAAVHSQTSLNTRQFVMDLDDDIDPSPPQLARQPLTPETVAKKLDELRTSRREALRIRSALGETVREFDQALRDLAQKMARNENRANRLCIQGRNEYSRTAIQADFAAGIRELDHEHALEEDEEEFDPTFEARDYDEVARNLPVFCVSSRAFQKLSGRLRRDAPLESFFTLEETEIPQLVSHCKELTEKCRAAACHAFFVDLGRLLNSLQIWASDEDAALGMTAEQAVIETAYIRDKLAGLDKALRAAIEQCICEIKRILQVKLFKKASMAATHAIETANTTASRWGAKASNTDPALRGLHWGTYRAVCRRNGTYTNAGGQHDFNAQLADPIVRGVAPHWERVFTQHIPGVFLAFSQQCDTVLKTSHEDIEAHSIERGCGAKRLQMLAAQQANYAETFGNIAREIRQLVEEAQRDANRDFVPVVAEHLIPAYRHCADEHGSGSYHRMKRHLEEQIEEQKHLMFPRSVDRVKTKLGKIRQALEARMAQLVEDAHGQLSRDYLNALVGLHLTEKQHQTRAAMLQLINEYRRIGRGDVGKGSEGGGVDAAPVSLPDAPLTMATSSQDDDVKPTIEYGSPTVKRIPEVVIPRGI